VTLTAASRNLVEQSQQRLAIFRLEIGLFHALERMDAVAKTLTRIEVSY